ncbi:MAG: hypothetical protein RIT81_31415 [Deltaproteobacteria bacterium]
MAVLLLDKQGAPSFGVEVDAQQQSHLHAVLGSSPDGGESILRRLAAQYDLSLREDEDGQAGVHDVEARIGGVTLDRLAEASIGDQVDLEAYLPDADMEVKVRAADHKVAIAQVGRFQVLQRDLDFPRVHILLRKLGL